MLLLIFYRFSCSVCNDMIILYKKKRQLQNKTQALNLCLLAQKKRRFLLFYRASETATKKEEKGGASWARHKRKKRGGLDSAPHPPKNTQGVWLAAQSPGSKGERKGLFCAFHPSGAQRHTSIQPHKHMLTRTRIYTDSYLLEGGSDLSLCARPTRKRWSTLDVFRNVEKLLWKHRLVRLLL